MSAACSRATDDPQGRPPDDIVYGRVASFGGSLSAEHGIGLIKRDRLSRSRSPAKLALTRSLKHAHASRGIPRSGRLFPSEPAGEPPAVR